MIYLPVLFCSLKTIENRKNICSVMFLVCLQATSEPRALDVHTYAFSQFINRSKWFHTFQ